MKTKPDLGIKDPYSLTSEQLDAAVELLKEQKANIGEYWSDYTKAVQAFESGTSVIGTTWQVIANTIGADNKVQVKTILPKEGVHRLVGHLDDLVEGRAPNCMYKWMDWITSPEVNAQVAEYFGEAPAQPRRASSPRTRHFCDIYHATDAKYADADPLLDDAAEASASTAAATTAPPTTSGSTSGSRSRGDGGGADLIPHRRSVGTGVSIVAAVGLARVGLSGFACRTVGLGVLDHRLVHRRGGPHVHRRQRRARAHRRGVPLS